MKPQHLFLALLICCSFFQFTFSQRDYQAGDIVHALAGSGLNMRDTPGLSGNKLGKIPLGDAVKVVGYDSPAVPFSYEGLSGHWLQVDHNGTKGYVFDGFVSKIPLFRGKDEFFYADSWLQENWEKDGAPVETTILNQDAEPISGEMQPYKASVQGQKVGILVRNIDEEFEEETTIRFPGLDMEEAFVLGMALDIDFSGGSLKHDFHNNYVDLAPINKDGFERTLSGFYDDNDKLEQLHVSYRHEAGHCWMTVSRVVEGATDISFGCYAD